VSYLERTTLEGTLEIPSIKTVIAATRAYPDAFDAAVASSNTAAEVQNKRKARFPAAQLDVILQIAASAAFPAAR
jgi:hypothetical protein